MASDAPPTDTIPHHHNLPEAGDRHKVKGGFWAVEKKAPHEVASSNDGFNVIKAKPEKWKLGVLNVLGSILLLSNTNRPSPFPPGSRSSSAKPPLQSVEKKKKTADGKMILEPQPDDSINDPLNWPSWRRNIALLLLDFYCMVGGEMTPVLAAGFSKVAATYNVSIPKVALTTGLYMMCLGLGSVFTSLTAILYKKRPIYLMGIILFIISAVWCALSPNYASLVVAGVFVGLAMSPVECLSSATIAEIFYLYERAIHFTAPHNPRAWLAVGVLDGGRILLFPYLPVRARNLLGALANISKIFSHDSQDEKQAVHTDRDGSLDMRKLAIGNSATAAGTGRATISERRKQRYTLLAK